MPLSPGRIGLTSLVKEVGAFKGRPQISEDSKRGWQEGVGNQQRPKYRKICSPELSCPTHKSSIGRERESAEILPESMVWEGCRCASPLCPPTFFEASESQTETKCRNSKILKDLDKK